MQRQVSSGDEAALKFVILEEIKTNVSDSEAHSGSFMLTHKKRLPVCVSDQS